jgi:hypothetical protein
MMMSLIEDGLRRSMTRAFISKTVQQSFTSWTLIGHRWPFAELWAPGTKWRWWGGATASRWERDRQISLASKIAHSQVRSAFVRRCGVREAKDT